MCGGCGSFDWSWQPIAGTGVIVSWITTHHGFLPGFAAPYHTVFVRIDEAADIVMPGSWFGDVVPHTGMRVRARFDDIAPDDSAQEDVEGTDIEGTVTLLGWTARED